MAHKRRFRKWLVHAVAYCAECRFSDENYITAQRSARNHANKTGHRVQLELGYCGEYGAQSREE